MLAATGIEAEAHLPFAGLHHLLRPVLSEMGRLPAAQRDALSTAFGMSDPRPDPNVTSPGRLGPNSRAHMEPT